MGKIGGIMNENVPTVDEDLVIWISYRDQVFLDAEELETLNAAKKRLRDMGERVMRERIGMLLEAKREKQCGKV